MRGELRCKKNMVKSISVSNLGIEKHKLRRFGGVNFVSRAHRRIIFHPRDRLQTKTRRRFLKQKQEKRSLRVNVHLSWSRSKQLTVEKRNLVAKSYWSGHFSFCRSFRDPLRTSKRPILESESITDSYLPEPIPSRDPLGHGDVKNHLAQSLGPADSSAQPGRRAAPPRRYVP
jgi:hypothetical protein